MFFGNSMPIAGIVCGDYPSQATQNFGVLEAVAFLWELKKQFEVGASLAAKAMKSWLNMSVSWLMQRRQRLHDRRRIPAIPSPPVFVSEILLFCVSKCKKIRFLKPPPTSYWQLTSSQEAQHYPAQTTIWHWESSS